MKGPIGLVRSMSTTEYSNVGPLFEWQDGDSYLIIDEVKYRGKPGAILCYQNPPMHQVSTIGLYAYHDGLDKVLERLENLDFLILYGPNDPVHSGGDLKESRSNLQQTLKEKQEMESNGATDEEVDALFNWGEDRLRKGIILYDKIRRAAEQLRVVGICGGGLRFGGSAEIQLMADYLVGDSRSGFCFSEAMIGIIPGWAGMARALTKAGLANAEYMTKTAREVGAASLEQIGIYNEVVDIPFKFPGRIKSSDPERDRKEYQELLEKHDYETGLHLLPKGLEMATCPKQEIPQKEEKSRMNMASREQISEEVAVRINPENYAHIRRQSLREIREEISTLGRPLAPQSIKALDYLLEIFNPSTYEEKSFIEEELKADAALYRDPKFLEGLTAMLEQRVPDFREP
jgi:enoyl-CoA hydratase/carnithine racemase